MKPPLHADDRFAAQMPEQEPPGVRLDRRHGEMRNFLVVDRADHLDAVDQRAEPGAEDDADFRLQVYPAFDISNGIVDHLAKFFGRLHIRPPLIRRF